ncbi:hypothetical protein MTsPCn9_13080 [Croceitalea sp. MTPC9]|uniref:hypothetical protein n=1 Tax=unclassified Croceitalea TaxID=2632280 RepID=UPI002B3CA6F4|nr:hypothetical protein MTsPCn6_16050 [Croceitalea sp. MTPC6]GMN16372.1 hypothetical protein MTsPCn9_13080 [Croceitalea sp. MTPC9]
MKVILVFLVLIQSWTIQSQNKADYTNYHKNIIDAEALIASEKYNEALIELTKTIEGYDFVFLKDIKIATQLAVFLNNDAKAFKFLELGIKSGWTLKEIKKNKLLTSLRGKSQWSVIIKSYPEFQKVFENRIDKSLKSRVKEMYKKDQKMAWSYLFRIGQTAKEKYANKKVKPHAIEQIDILNRIIDDKGYPGEKLIGEPVWMSTILSHHNSVSEDFVKTDTLYDNLRPKLLTAIRGGELNPYEFALMEDWRITIKHDRQKPGFGYIESLKPEQVSASNELRKQIGIRSVELRNNLVAIEEKTGMDFYLAGSGWVDGKIGL